MPATVKTNIMVTDKSQDSVAMLLKCGQLFNIVLL